MGFVNCKSQSSSAMRTHFSLIFLFLYSFFSRAFFYACNTIYFCFVLRHYQKSMVKLINILHKSATFYSNSVLLKNHQPTNINTSGWEMRILIPQDSIHTQSQCRQLSNKIGAKFKNDFWLHLTPSKPKVCLCNLPKYV